MPDKVRNTIFLLIFGCFFSQTALSQSQNNFTDSTSATLKEIVVTYQARRSTPVPFQNIGKAEIAARATGQEPSFLLATMLPGVTNYSDAGSGQGYSYIRLRGIDQTRIAFSLDGAPINEPEDQGAYPSNWPDMLQSVSQIQVQRGAGLSKNGVANFAGSVQFTSPDLQDTAYTRLGVNYGSFATSRVFGEWHSGLRKNKAMYARFSRSDSDGYKYHSGNHGQSAFVSAGKFTERTVWKWNLLAGNQRNGLAWLGVADTLITRDRRTNANAAQERDNFTQMLTQLRNTTRVGTRGTFEASGYYNYSVGNYDFDFNNFLGLPSTVELYNYHFRSHLAGGFANYRQRMGNVQLTTGAHANRYQREHLGSEKTIGQLYVNTGYKTEVSAFLRVDYTYQKFKIFTDAQYRRARFEYQGTAQMQPLTWSFFNPKVGVSYAASHQLTAYYSLSSTGREPTRNDIFGGNDDALADTLGNALMFVTKAESVLDHECGLRYQSARLRLDANVYYMDFSNEIVLVGKFGPNGLPITDGVDRSYRTGLEISADYAVNKNWTIVHRSALNKSRITDEKTVFSPVLTPALVAQQELVYTAAGKRLALALGSRYQSSAYMDFSNTAKLPAYFLLQARGAYAWRKLTFSAHLNNLTNTKYYNNGYVEPDGTRKYFVQAPMSGTAGVVWSF